MIFGVHPLIVGCPLAGNVARKRATYSAARRQAPALHSEATT